MSPHLLMLAGLMLGAPPAPAPDAAPAPRFEKGMEITWKGTFNEAILRSNVRAFREYELETRLFVLDHSAELGSDVALYTSVRLKPEHKNLPEPPPIVRLELARVHPDGQLSYLPPNSLQTAQDKRQALEWPLQPLEGLPTVEPRVVVPFPPGPLKLGLNWKLDEPKRPQIKFRVEGYDSVHGSRCIKVYAGQQTDDWDRLRTEATAWRRGEIVCVSAKHGWATRIERTIEKKDPQSGEIGFRSKLQYEQSGTMRYPDRFGEDRRAEIAAAAEFLAEFERAVADPQRVDARPFEQLLKQIEQHAVSHFSGESVPYRQAIEYVKRKAEAAARGHIPPQPPPPETSEAPPLVVGKEAPAIATSNLVNGEGVRWAGFKGRAVILLYYQPSSVRTAEPVLRFAQKLTDLHGGQAYVLPVAIGDHAAALEQRNGLLLTVPILWGRDAHKVHGIESTPTFVLIDAEGIVRGIHLGWSDEVVAKVRQEFPRLIK